MINHVLTFKAPDKWAVEFPTVINKSKLLRSAEIFSKSLNKSTSLILINSKPVFSLSFFKSSAISPYCRFIKVKFFNAVSYTHLRAHET